MNTTDHKTDERPKALIIGGMMRSGTTLLQKLCNRHPQIVMGNETHIFNDHERRLPGYYRGLSKKWLKKYRWLVKRNGAAGQFAVLRFWFPLLLRGPRKIGLKTIHHSLQNIFPQAAYVGDKYPRYIFKLSGFVQYDAMRVIIIYRDGRDVAQSVLARLKTDWKDKAWAQRDVGTLHKIAVRWVEAIEQMEKYRDQVHIIRYEELVTDPGPVLAKLADYLDVDPAGFDHTIVRPTSIGKYKDSLSDDQLAEFMAVAGPTMQRLGYSAEEHND